MMMRSVAARSTVAILVTGSLIFGGTACSKSGDKAAEKIAGDVLGGDVDIDSKDGSVKIKTEDGEATYGKKEIPDGWPKEVPFPDGFEVSGSMTSSNNGQDYMAVTGTTDKSAKEVADFYKDKLSDWELSSESNFDGDSAMTMVVFSKGDHSVNASASEKDDNTELVVTWGSV